MKKILVFLIYALASGSIFSQDLSGNQLLDKAIAYHDPDSKWNTFKADFFVSMESPNRPLRKSKIAIDFPASIFRLEANLNEKIMVSTLVKDECKISFNGSEEFSEEIKKEYRLDCERAFFYKNYYTYLYGLPMKLKDPGTIIDPKVEKKKIDGKEYWMLKVTYDETVGKDTWYFFFDQNTYALKHYQFFHDESKNDGEYIELEDELVIGGIKMPKNRSWYYNSNNQFLGIDRLSKN